MFIPVLSPLSVLLCTFLLSLQQVPVMECANSTPIRCERPGKCSCPQDPLTARYPDPVDTQCQRYYLCHLGNAFHKRCKVREAFHPVEKECLPRGRVPYDKCPLCEFLLKFLYGKVTNGWVVYHSILFQKL